MTIIADARPDTPTTSRPDWSLANHPGEAAHVIIEWPDDRDLQVVLRRDGAEFAFTPDEALKCAVELAYAVTISG